eukprot:jgi/Botrbrau1/20621/Bobra.113_1s0046.1
MHPPLHLHKHPHCREEILAIVTCHKDHPYAKFWGACNEQKWALDRCFREEKAIKRSINLEKAKVDQERYKAKRALEKEEQTAASVTS